VDLLLLAVEDERTAETAGEDGGSVERVAVASVIDADLAFGMREDGFE
jgi:hypothetical protein